MRLALVLALCLTTLARAEVDPQLAPQLTQVYEAAVAAAQRGDLAAWQACFTRKWGDIQVRYPKGNAADMADMAWQERLPVVGASRRGDFAHLLYGRCFIPPDSKDLYRFWMDVYFKLEDGKWLVSTRQSMLCRLLDGKNFGISSKDATWDSILADRWKCLHDHEY